MSKPIDLEEYTPIEETSIFKTIKAAFESGGGNPRTIAIIVRDEIITTLLKEVERKRVEKAVAHGFSYGWLARGSADSNTKAEYYDELVDGAIEVFIKYLEQFI